MKIGRVLWAELGRHYQRGLEQVRDFQKIWDRMEKDVHADWSRTCRGR
jgi:alpha-glucuronidase